MTRYNIPINIRTYINSFYSNISAKLFGNKWTSNLLTFSKDFFKGRSVLPYYIYMCNGCYLNNQTHVISNPFADDFNVIPLNAQLLRKVKNYA